jgi:hypothetical protein
MQVGHMLVTAGSRISILAELLFKITPEPTLKENNTTAD